MRVRHLDHSHHHRRTRTMEPARPAGKTVSAPRWPSSYTALLPTLARRLTSSFTRSPALSRTLSPLSHHPPSSTPPLDVASSHRPHTRRVREADERPRQWPLERRPDKGGDRAGLAARPVRSATATRVPPGFSTARRSQHRHAPADPAASTAPRTLTCPTSTSMGMGPPRRRRRCRRACAFM